MKKIFALIGVGVSLLLSGCDKESVENFTSNGPALKLSLNADLGCFFTHDFYLVNQSGLKLSDCCLEFKLIDAEGKEYPGSRSFQTWAEGEKIHVSVSLNRTTDNPQQFKCRVVHVYEGKQCHSKWFEWSLN